ASMPVFYTTDGSDPKSPDALSYDSEIPLDDSVHLKARAWNGTEWSALSEATFVARDVIPLRITEIMYHPAPSPDLLFDEEDFEFVELYNPGRDSVPLEGIRLQGGIGFDFSASDVKELFPGEYLLVVKSLEAFRARYGDGLLIAGEYS